MKLSDEDFQESAAKATMGRWKDTEALLEKRVAVGILQRNADAHNLASHRVVNLGNPFSSGTCY